MHKHCKHIERQVGLLKVTCNSSPTGLKNTTVCMCALHGRCLPYWRGPWDEPQKEVEAKIYTLCKSKRGSPCPDYERPRRK